MDPITTKVQLEMEREQAQWQQSSTGSGDKVWTCPYCKQLVQPMEFNVGGRVFNIRRGYCECPGGQAEQAEAKRREAEAKRADQYGDLMRRAGIDEGVYRRMTLESWETTRHAGAANHVLAVMDYIREVKLEGPNFAYFWGKYGTGKTHLAVAALRQITFDHLDAREGYGWRPAFVEWTTHCSAVQQSWDKDNGPTESQLWAKMQGADILVIDDLDKRQPTEWAIGKLYEAIQYRYTREKPTIITANHSIEQLQQSWSNERRPEYIKDAGGAILSRILGALWGQVEFTGDDQRMR